VLAAIGDGSITLLPAVPYMLDVLVRSAAGARVGGALRRVISAGGPLPEAVRREFVTRFRRRRRPDLRRDRARLGRLRRSRAGRARRRRARAARRRDPHR
jgi:hypothetical protein